MIEEPKQQPRVPDGPIHEYFGLTYASYSVIPRSILQSLPIETQQKFVDLNDEVKEILEKQGVEWPLPGHTISVRLRDEKGLYTSDPLASYERGRRRLW